MSAGSDPRRTYAPDLNTRPERGCPRLAYYFDYADGRGTLDHATHAIEPIGDWIAATLDGRGRFWIALSAEAMDPSPARRHP
ncbi:hypothetical protein ACFV9E_30565 [Streptomyces sp. NPDC059835]|uniref:hypothetical protein n=1 Tax=Streptomyces sp. NPDC059835 TaxID=3346967 RepID=UPI003647423A